jgi:cellulose synthase/poly-beta-1,6-N-acetylglucosamine synthase-like glycosyltransferase
MIDIASLRPLVSIVVRADNETLTAVDSVRPLLALDCEAREIVVINDGSQDGTLEALRVASELVPAPVAFIEGLKTAHPCAASIARLWRPSSSWWTR